METRLVVLLALAASAIAGPITQQESDRCSTECSDSSKFNYAPGTTYTYDYKVDTATSMAGASEDTAKLTLQTSADIEVMSPCEFALILRNTRLFHSDANGGMKAADNEDNFRRGLETSVLRFSFQDDLVDSVCPDDREDAWALNIKKGILSAFQNGMDDLSQGQNVTETDVTGTCKTEYEFVRNGYYYTSIKKTKNLLTCTDRNAYKTMLQMVSYKLPSDMNSLPLMKTTHECEQKIENGGVLQLSTCTESHVYRPFSNKQSGGVTTVKQTLTFQTSRRGVNSRQSTVSARDTLCFDHSATQPDAARARYGAEQKLREICDTTGYDIRPESPRLFSELVSVLRSVDKAALEDIDKQLKTKSMCASNDKTYKFFLDALPMISTSASVNLMTSLITSGDVKGIQAKAWIASLAFVQTPTSDMLLAAKALVDNEKVRDDALLPVSSMVNNYCQKTSCGQDYAVLSIIASLERSIGYSCDASGDEFNKVLLSLRAIGNAGHATRAVSVINRCLTASSNPLEIRIAAANAYRRMPCDAQDDDLWSVYGNTDLDSELRIAAYLALMRCPSDMTLGKMAASLENEEDDQVGAFVYSHLTNLRETSDPHKQDVARAINNLALEKDFDLSPLKFSRNYEASALINKINTGFVAESNLIWSNTAQLPRSISGNLTVDLFGQAINLVDFGGRLEGMEYLIKNLFGPYMTAEDKEDTKYMSRLDADDVQGSIYGRIFGNEMLFLHSKAMKSPLKEMPSSWLDMLIKLANKNDIALTQSAQFMDVSMIIPTAAGLPINIDVNGTATVDLVLNGKADLRKLGSSPRSLDVDGEIRPSAAMEITGSMSVDAFVTKTGLRMRSTLHTSTAMKGRIQLERGQQLNIELDTPQDKIEIFDARSKFFIVHNNVEQEQAMITKNRKQFDVCSGEPLSTITGMELCGQISFPNASMENEGPYFPLTGPVSASVTLFKRDAHTGYKLFAKRVESKQSSIAQISFNTPGSRVNRAILLDMTLDYPKQEFESSISTPWKKAAFRGNMIDKKELKSLTGSLVIDDTDTYAMTTEVKVSETKAKIQLNPMFELRRPGADNIQLTGYVAAETPMKSFDMDLSLSGLNKMPYTIKTSVNNNKKEKSVRASFSTDGKTEYSLLASSQTSIMGRKAIIMSSKNLIKVNTPARQVLSADGIFDYREGKSLKMDGSLDIHRLLKKPANVKVTLLKNEKKRGVRYDVDAILKSTPISGRVDSYVFMKTSGLLSTKTMVDYTIPKVARNKVILSGKFNDRSTKAYNKYTLKSNLDVKKNPEYNMGLNFDVDHKKKHSEAEVEFRYGPNPKDKTKRLYLSTSLNRKIPNYKNAVLNYKMKAEAPCHNIDISLNGKHQHTPKMVDSDVTLNYGKGKDVSASVFYKDQSSKLLRQKGNMNIAWPGKQYTLNSDLAQKSAKQYSHVINLKSNDGMKHTITTIYKTPNPKTHDFSTNFGLDGLTPFTVGGSTTLDPKNFEVAGNFKQGKATYGLSAVTKMSKYPGGRALIEVVYPERRMTLEVDGGKQKNKFDGRVEAAWDADKDKSQKITIEGSGHHKANKKSVSLGGNLAFSSPFENFEDLKTAFKYGSDDAQHDLSGRFSWDGKGNQVQSTMNVKNPISLNNIIMTFETKTPFKGFRVITGDIAHKLDKTLSTIIKGRWEKENAKLAIQGEDLSDSSKSSYKGNIALKSSLKNAEDVTLSLDHTQGAGSVTSKASLNHNGKSYAYDLDMNHSSYGWQIRHSGDLKLTTPRSKINTNWQHKNTDNSVKSTLTSDWDNERILVDLTGSQDLASQGTVNGVLKVQSPWNLGDIIVSLNHKHGYGFVDSSAALKESGKPIASSSVKLNTGNDNADLGFTLASPFHEDIDGKVSASYGSFPMTSVIEFQWDPRKKMTVEGSLNTPSWDNADADVKITTPFRGYRNVNFKASNKKEGDELVSHAIFDYGVRKTIDLESRMACNDQRKMARVKMTTPFDELQSLDTGFTFTGQSYDFDTSADFELVPIVGKFQGLANWQYNDEMRGKVRIDTPFRDYPYFQISTLSQKKGAARQSHIEAEYYPRQVYSFDSTYSFDLPISFEATINSPYPEYNNLGVVLQHNHSPSSVQSHGEVRYQPGQTIEGDLNADWSSNIEGNMILKTPFSGYETSKVALRHQGDMDSFATHGEVNVAEQSVIADATFNSGYRTTGTFTFSSPIPGMENIAFNMKKKGHSNNIKGDATLTINGDKYDADFNHKLSSGDLKSSLKFNSPYTQPLKFSIEHDGVPTSFTNKMSANYGRDYDIDTVASFDYREPDVNGNGMIKYKLGGGQDTVRVSFSKTGLVEDMSFSGTATYNRDDISVNGSWKTVGGIDGSVQIKTPFDNFKSVGMTMSHNGDLNDFRSNANINYMDNKNINGKVEMNAYGLRRIRFNSEIATPFDFLPSANVVFNNDYDEYRMSLNGNAALTTPVAGFGTGNIVYSKTGGLDDLAIETSVNKNGQEMTNFKLTNTLLPQEMHSKVDFKAASYPSVVMTFDHMGDVSNFNSKAFGKIGRNSVSGEVTKRGSIDDMTFSGTARYNRDSIDVNGSWKNQGSIDGSLEIKTPFQNFRDVGMTVSHSGDASDFTSSASVNYMDNKNINGKVTLTTDGLRSISFTSDLNTPFVNFESTKVNFNNYYNEYDMGVNGNAAVTTTVNGFGSAGIKYSKTGGLNDLVVEGSTLRNGQEMSSLKITNNMQYNEVHSFFNYKCSVVPEITFTLDHNGDLNSFSTKARGMVGNNIVSGEANLSQRGSTVDADGKVMYKIESLGSNQGSLSIHKEGQLDDFSVKATGKYANKESTVSGAFKVRDEITGSITVNTPIRGYKNVGMSFKHSGNLERFNCEGQMNLADGEQYSGKLNFYRYLYRRIETTAELRTPIAGYEFTKFEYRHEGENDLFKCYSTLEYGNSQKITYDLSASMQPNPDFSVTIKTPYYNYENLMASATIETTWPKLGITSKVNAGDGRIVSLNGAFDASNDITGNIVLSTPIDGFSDVGLEFQHSGTIEKFNCEGKVTYMDGQDISGKLSFKLRRPFLSAEVKTPVYGYEDLMASASLENEWPKYGFTSKVNAGNGNVFTFNTELDASSDIKGSVAISTPMDGFTDIGMSFFHSGNDQKFNSEGKVTYMDGQDIVGKVNFYRYMWRRVVASAELTTPFSGVEYTKGEVNFEDNSNSISTTAAVEYSNGQKMNGNMKLTYSPSYDVLITLNTPFYDYRVVRAQGSLDMSAPSYSASYSVNYGYNQAYSANGKLNLYSIENIDGSLEVTIPVSGYEYTKAEYKHTADSSRVDGSASLTYGNGQVISGELKTTIYPNFDGTVTVKTPFYGYENMQGSATFDSSYEKYDVSSSLNLGRGYDFSMTSGLDYSTEPIRASTKISTPYADFRNMELAITHEGTITDFRCTGFLASPLTDNVNAKASFKYDNVYDMSASASLQSSIAGMDDMKVELKNSDLAGEKKTHAVVGWTQGQQISLDGLFRKQDGWYEDKIHTDVSLATPFIAVRSLGVQMDHSGRTDGFTENVNIELNGAKLLDMDSEYSSKNKHEASVTIRQPWPMQYTASASTENGVSEADIMVNWDRDQYDSNVRVLATVNDKSSDYQTDRSLDIGIEHASRKVGVTHQLTSSAQKTVSNGKIYWDSDDGSRIFYDLQLNDNSRRRRDMLDGAFKLGLPTRTLGLSGSFSDNNVAKAVDATFSWDADRDDSQQVGVKATMTSGEKVKGDVTISMPSIRKEIRVDGEVMMKNGRVILDTKTDISYSQDSRKTLTLTSKLEDITDYYSNYNYSLELGVSHPYTNVDVHMTSHLGSSDERMTVGIKTDYLTARRQNKNMALLAEINTLKKQINLQFTNPMNKIEVVGDVVSTSPYKVRMLNRVDDVEAFSSDLTLDSDKKSMTFNAYMDSERLTVSALYPNSSAFSAYVTHSTPMAKHTEALLGVRLNTSRLLHTRVHWRPEMMEEIRQIVLDRAMEKGARAQEMFTAMNNEFATELSGKYTAITNAFSEEMKPLIDILHREMAMVALRMGEFQRDLRAKYERNDFYIQDMGEGANQYYMEFQEKLQQLTQNYRQSYSELIRSMNDNLKEMTSFPIRERYSEFVDESITWLNDHVQQCLTSLEEYLAEADQCLQEYRDTMQQYKKNIADTVYNATYVDYVANKIGQVKNIDISPYVSSFEIPEEYTNAIYNIHNSMNEQLSDLLSRPEIKYIGGGVNEVYQQGVWAYNYWQLEENLYKHAHSILNTLKEIVEDEMKEYIQNVQALYKNPITIWDPKNGEVQADFILPFEVQRLDEVPDFSPLVEKAEGIVAVYMPDQSTWDNVVDSLPELWSEDVSDDKADDDNDDEMTKQFKKYKPANRPRKYKKARKYRIKKSRA